MTSAEAKELFSAAYDGELLDEQQAGFDQALATDPELARQFDEFCDTMNAALLSAAPERIAGSEPAAVVPDLLPGVQSRLRARSAGRFYADRFAEKSGKGLTGPLSLAVIMVALCALLWVAYSLMQAVSLKP